MADRAHIPNSAGLRPVGDAFGGRAGRAAEARGRGTFTAHMAVCPACTALFEEARHGREWLEFLSPEPEVPAGLLDKILAQTGPGQVEGYGLIPRQPNVVPMPPVQLAASGLHGQHSPLCRAPPADDGGHGLLLHRSDAQPDRCPLEQRHLAPAPDLRPISASALFHGAPSDHGLDSDHSLLRPPALCLRGGVEDAGAAPHHRRQGGHDNQAAKPQPAGTPGESKQTPGRQGRRIPHGSSLNSRAKPATDRNDSNDLWKASLRIQPDGPAHSGGSKMARRE